MINIKNLYKSYKYKGKRRYVFKDINITIESGESLAILGPNGTGKSTLIRLIGGIEIPDSGTIIKDCSISWPMGVSAGFQGSLSARENITFITKIYGYSKKEEINKKIGIIRNFANIGEYFDRPFKTYSSGMKGRISFGLSLAFKFDVYLLDEVTAKGDKNFKDKCNEALNTLKKTSSFIISSHNLQFIKNHADRAIVIKNQSIKEYNDITEAYEASVKISNKI